MSSMHTTGAIKAAAVLTVVNDDKTASVDVNVGDVLTDLTMRDAYGNERSIDKAEVLGFYGKPNPIKGFNDTVFDGIPYNVEDPQKNGFTGMIDEVLAVSAVVVSYTDKVGAPPIREVINVSEIVSVNGKPEDDEGGEDDPEGD